MCSLQDYIHELPCNNQFLLLYIQGNQENRVVIYDYKAIDYINFILRAGDIAECPPEKVGKAYIMFCIFFISYLSY